MDLAAELEAQLPAIEENAAAMRRAVVRFREARKPAAALGKLTGLHRCTGELVAALNEHEQLLDDFTNAAEAEARGDTRRRGARSFGKMLVTTVSTVTKNLCAKRAVEFVHAMGNAECKGLVIDILETLQRAPLALSHLSSPTRRALHDLRADAPASAPAKGRRGGKRDPIDGRSLARTPAKLFPAGVSDPSPWPLPLTSLDGCVRDARCMASAELAEALTAALHADVAAREAPPETRRDMQTVLADLEGAIRNACHGKPFRLAPFGSAATGLAARASDIDVVCVGRRDAMAATAAEIRLKKDPHGRKRRVFGAPAPMVWLQTELQDRGEEWGFVIREFVAFARVPVMKLLHEPTSIEVDVTFNSVVGVHNSEMIRAYMQADPLDRPRRLVTAVKAWARAAGVKDASTDTLSSFAYTLLVIFFLQQRGVLPCLQAPGLISAYGSWRGKPLAAVDANGFEVLYCADDAFIAHLVTARVRSGRFSTESTGSLLVGFFDYYTRVFDWSEQAVSIRLGRPRTRSDWPDAVPGRIGIEDPFENQRDLCVTMGKDGALAGQDRVLEEMVRARELLEGGLTAWAKASSAPDAATRVIETLVGAKA